MSRYIEGQDRSQVTLLSECLDDYIAEDNTVRVVDAFINDLDMVAHAQSVHIKTTKVFAQ